MFGNVDWGTAIVSIVLGGVVGGVPLLLSFFLNRKGANKKLNLDETSVMLTGTNQQIEAYQDLLDRANAAVTKAETLNTQLSKRIEILEQTRTDQDWQINILRSLFRQVVQRSNITLTAEEQAEFDSTKPRVV